MHSRREQKSFLAALRIKFNAFLTVAFCIEDLFLDLNIHLFICIFLPFLTPMKTRPTGLSLVLPFGPAIPVIETLMLALDILDKFLTISVQHSWLTAPHFLIIFLGSPLSI